MAEKKVEDNESSMEPTASSSSNPPNRLNSQRRTQEQNNAVFARLFASLDSEHRKLKELEERRSRLTEEMKHLRALLFAENTKLRQTMAPAPGNAVPGANPIAQSEASAGSSVNPIVKPLVLSRKSSSKSVTIAEPPIQSAPIKRKASSNSVQSLQKRGSSRGLKASSKKIKRRMMPKNISDTREEMLDILDESGQSPSAGSTLRSPEHRRSNPEIRKDVDDVLGSLSALFTITDGQQEGQRDSQLTEPSSTNSLTNEDFHPKNSEEKSGILSSDQDPGYYLPSVNSLLKNLLGSRAAPIPLIELPEVSNTLPSVEISESSAIVEEVLQNETEKKTD
ncbi:uncharacterized protein LOC108097886 [Drosophila ficusphila]|uniref:uncharacterized protein LOC108097886 n=1 Tax=Drosophila ficusphila TaxID=30025 RepID=UPI0007E75321|nr:uncharacterized protein LOC108097886 [Drosophila ficusphila]